MGVNLSPITEAREIDLEYLRGKSVAIDAYNTIFQFLSIIRQPDGKPLQDSQGRITSHLSGILYRTANLIEAGIEPSFVFDGKPNEMKAGTIEERIARREKAMVEYQQALEEGDLPADLPHDPGHPGDLEGAADAARHPRGAGPERRGGAGRVHVPEG